MSIADQGSPAESGAAVPVYTRKATGLVREVSWLDQLLFNAASTTPLGAGLIFGLFTLTLFPRANIYISMVVALALGVGVWVTFALLSAAIPRSGGDYTFNSRILHPWIGLAGNLSLFVSTAIASGLWAWWFGTQGLAPAFSVIGSVTHHAWFTNAGNYLSGPTHRTASFLVTLAALAVVSAVSIKGTRYVVRAMTILFVIASIGFVIDMIILLATSSHSFQNTVNSAAGTGAYQKAAQGAVKDGLVGGTSVKNTIGGVYEMISITLFVWWGCYLASEFRGAGQRRRQLSTTLGAGLGQGLLVMIAMAIFLTTVGRNFFTGALAGHYSAGSGTVGTAGYAYFSSLVADNTFGVVVLAFMFVGWFLPGLYINLAMVQRAFMTWSFDGLLPSKVADVDERTHTPVIAIVLAAIAGAAGGAWASYGSNFFQLFAVMQLFAYIPVVLVGVTAAVIKRRRPDLYRGTPAEWRVGGVDVLPIAGIVATAVGCVAIALVLYFHMNVGIVGGYYTGMLIAPVVVFALAALWWYGARAYRYSHGVNLDLAYKVIPPD